MKPWRKVSLDHVVSVEVVPCPECGSKEPCWVGEKFGCSSCSDGAKAMMQFHGHDAYDEIVKQYRGKN